MLTPSAAARLAVCAALLAALAAFAFGCGSDGERNAGASKPVTEMTAVVANKELAVGENRFIVGLLDQDTQEIIGAEVAFRFFKLGEGDQQTLKGEAEAKALSVEKSYTHTHDDGTVEAHSAGATGVYVAYPTFDEAGSWGVEVTATIEGKAFDPVGAAFTVLDKANSVAVGAPAPQSDTLTLDEVANVSEIDTSDPPIPEMHTMSIAEAVTSGRPSVIVFATPAFCTSRICGPTKEIVDELFQQFKDQVVFVHVEPYDLKRARDGEGLFPVAAATEWGLQSEPWVFLVDAQGMVAAKFEGVVTLDELQDALRPLLSA
ncbi:MAG TPA: hypothetical protein VJN32_01155 [Dehalococcoidia bacterium]|nr:hypothetical protein [Dehalococcoidia bacterium]